MQRGPDDPAGQPGGRPLVATYHPAYLLRNPTREPNGPKALTWRDIKEVRRRYDELRADGQL